MAKNYRRGYFFLAIIAAFVAVVALLVRGFALHPDYLVIFPVLGILLGAAVVVIATACLIHYLAGRLGGPAKAKDF